MKAFTDATRRHLAPVKGFSQRDRLSVNLDKDGTHFILKFYRESFSGTTFPTSNPTRQFVERLPERKELTGQHETYQAPTTDYTAAVIQHCYPQGQVVMADDAAIVFKYLLATIELQEKVAENTARWRDYNTALQVLPTHYRPLAGGLAPAPLDVSKYETNNELPLSLYQLVGVDSLRHNEGFGLFMEQGTGKTPVVVAEVCNEARELKEDRMFRSLIVCPKNVRMNWVGEFQRFSTRRGKVTVLRGSPIKRIKLLADAFRQDQENPYEYTTVVCSYETLSASWNALGLIEWDLSVLDESHYIKNPNAKRTKAAMQLRDRSLRRAALTGTPIANTIMDLYSQLEFLGKGFSGFSSHKAFKSFYGVWKPSESGHKALVGVQNLPFMQERLARCSYVVRKADVLSLLPDKVYDVWEVEMTPEQEELYTKIAEQLAVEIEDELNRAENKQLIVTNILTKLLRLAQVTSGFIKWDAVHGDDGSLIREAIIDRIDPNPKIEGLVEMMKEKGPNDKTIIWSCWVQDIKSIAARLKQEGIDCVTYYGATSEANREEAERRFNYDPNCKVFIGNPDAGGTGLNLIGYPPGDESYETNCNHEIFFAQGWSSVKRSQAEDRAHRRGTREPVRITDLCVPGTIDEEIRTRVLLKRQFALEVSDLRDIVRNILKGGLEK